MNYKINFACLLTTIITCLNLYASHPGQSETINKEEGQSLLKRSYNKKFVHTWTQYTILGKTPDLHMAYIALKHTSTSHKNLMNYIAGHQDLITQTTSSNITKEQFDEIVKRHQTQQKPFIQADAKEDVVIEDHKKTKQQSNSKDIKIVKEKGFFSNVNSESAVRSSYKQTVYTVLAKEPEHTMVYKVLEKIPTHYKEKKQSPSFVAGHPSILHPQQTTSNITQEQFCEIRKRYISSTSKHERELIDRNHQQQAQLQYEKLIGTNP